MCANYNGFRPKRSNMKPGKCLGDAGGSKEDMITILAAIGYDYQYLLRMTKKELTGLGAQSRGKQPDDDIFASFERLDDNTEF